MSQSIHENIPDQPFYDHPPITEAVIGINFGEAINEGALTDLQGKFAGYYPDHQLVENLSLKVALAVGADNRKTANADVAQEVGHRRSTADMTELIVLLPNSIVVSQLAPYPGWNLFFDRFVRDWNIVKHVLGYRQISRIGVRYINRIDIPIEDRASVVQHEEYLNVYPRVPDVFGPLTAYGVQAEIFMEDLSCKLIINSAAVPSPILRHASFLVDQDIVRDIDVPQKDEEILSLLERVRVRKNEVFELCVADRARGLFRNAK